VELEDLFVQAPRYAQAMKRVKLGTISLDGAKIKANASKHQALSHDPIEKLEAQLREEVQGLLQKAAETDPQEAGDEHDLPAEIALREQRLKAKVSPVCVVWRPSQTVLNRMQSEKLIFARCATGFIY
jgi:hypothetical protein